MAAAAQRRILVVDDEPALLSLMEQFLRRLGYQVEACSSGAEAFRRFEADPASYALVLADIIMPGMSGRDLVLKLLERNPEVCVLICTGAPFHPAMLPPEVRRQVGLLQKPFAPQMLAEAIERLLGAPSGSPGG